MLLDSFFIKSPITNLIHYTNKIFIKSKIKYIVIGLIIKYNDFKHYGDMLCRLDLMRLKRE